MLAAEDIVSSPSLEPHAIDPSYLKSVRPS